MISRVALRWFLAASFLVASMASAGIAGAEEVWLTDYSAAVKKATEEKKMLLVYFSDGAVSADVEASWTADSRVAATIPNYVLLKTPTTGEVSTAQGAIKLLSHPAFAEMQGSAGFAVIDYRSEGTAHYGQVVTVYPFRVAGVATANHLQWILTLPAGTLTQRTLILAVRLHPEAPASTNGEFDPALASEAESHAQHQASIRLQGHHSWETRFHRINNLLSRRRGGAWSSVEVCAESWPGQGLFESAVECVRCWRLSSGHWNAVRSGQATYGYDMKRGSNGVWYAAGIFGNFRR